VADPDPGFPRTGVLDDVSESLLRDAIQTYGNVGRNSLHFHFFFFKAEPDTKSAVFGKFSTKTAESAVESQMFERHRVKLMTNVSEVIR
jgi:hypothetical protein